MLKLERKKYNKADFRLIREGKNKQIYILFVRADDLNQFWPVRHKKGNHCARSRRRQVIVVSSEFCNVSLRLAHLGKRAYISSLIPVSPAGKNLGLEWQELLMFLLFRTLLPQKRRSILLYSAVHFNLSVKLAILRRKSLVFGLYWCPVGTVWVLPTPQFPRIFPPKIFCSFQKRHDQGRSSGVGPGSGQGGKIAAAAAGGGERRWNSGGRKEELDRQIGKQRFQALDNSVWCLILSFRFLKNCSACDLVRILCFYWTLLIICLSCQSSWISLAKNLSCVRILTRFLISNCN